MSIFDLQSHVMTSATSSINVSGSLNIRRGHQRDLYNRLLLGTAARSEVGQNPDQAIYTASLPNQKLSYSFSANDLPLSSSFLVSAPQDVKWLIVPSGSQATKIETTASFSSNPNVYIFSGTGYQIPAGSSVLMIGVKNGNSIGSIVTFTGSSGPYYMVVTASNSSVFGDTVGLVVYGTGTNPALTATFQMESASFELIATAGNRIEFTGSLNTSYGSQLATSPSWTQDKIGKRHGFVIPAYSASQHESTILNAYDSGSAPLETSAVPASASMYYDKSNRYVKIMYKRSASSGMFAGNNVTAPFSLEVSGRTLNQFLADSGSFINRGRVDPAIVEFDVREYGRIRDIKVWVEFIHDVRTHTGSIGTSSLSTEQGLQSVKIALRSPNTNFEHAVPVLNTSQMSTLGKDPNSNAGTPSAIIPEIMRNSYLLWDGHIVDFDHMYNVDQTFWHDYSQDIDMRTVFTDGSSISNPRHNDRIFELSSSAGSEYLNEVFLSASAPNVVFSEIAGYPFIGTDRYAAWGNNIPWMYDSRIKPGFITGSTTFTQSLGLSPPRGWLNGAGQTAAENEFPTTGSQIGPATIKPVYPLLDDVVEESIMLAPGGYGENISFSGFRPGLRGTEVHGIWKLMFAVSTTDAGDYARKGIWFRQARLEFTIDQNRGPVYPYASKSRRFRKSGLVPQNSKKAKIHSNRLTNAIQTVQIFAQSRVYTHADDEYGRSIGITDNTGSMSDFAVFARITGSLLDRLTGSTAFFLKNEFGTPYIPLSSGSGVTASFDELSQNDRTNARALLDNVLRPKTQVSPAQNVKSTLNRTNYFQTTRDQAADQVVTQQTSGSS